jgi:uncharacterized membrane protein
MRLIYFFMMFILTIPLVSSAIIQGSVYDLSFNKITDGIITIDTTPIQTKVLENGEYKFEVPNGTYILTAKKYENNVLTQYINQSIKVNSDGNFVLDLILFPVDETNDLLNINEDNNLNLYFEKEEKTPISKYVIYSLLVLAILVSFYLKYKKYHPNNSPKHNKREVKETKTEKTQPIIDEKYNTESEDLEKHVLEFITEQNTTSQLEIRTKFPQYSEAKISLVISKLESENKIKKYKKGRANIISKI